MRTPLLALLLLATPASAQVLPPGFVPQEQVYRAAYRRPLTPAELKKCREEDARILAAWEAKKNAPRPAPQDGVPWWALAAGAVPVAAILFRPRDK